VSVRGETRYARSGDVSIAYRVLGEGPFDLVYVPPAISNVELMWDQPWAASYFERLASFSRLIVFDKRGTGASDRVAGLPSLEARMDDLRAVMDAAGSERAAVFGLSEGGPMALLFAATYPGRVPALVVYGSLPRYAWAPDAPWGRRFDEREIEEWASTWGTPESAAEMVAMMAPDYAGDEQAVRRMASWQRLSASPGALIQLERMNAEIDVRHVLPSIQCPTLVLHKTDDANIPIEAGRYMAEQIPSARLVELPGSVHFDYHPEAVDRILDEAESFLVGIWEAGGWDEPEPDRVLATVLFTDIVGSTAKALELGDARWRDLLAQHHAAVRAQLARFRGREVDTAGDGVFAAFDGPARAIRCACAVREAVGRLGLDVRAGLHSGECELVDGKIGGIAVHIGARVAAEAGAGEVLVSSTVRDLVAGSGLEFEDRGPRELKDLPGEWRLYAVRTAT
jgi:class 3 adenylate cyclase